MALQADGWYLRSEVVWSKPNPMPESVTDRPTKAHEQVFLLTKSPRYFYDAEAVREPHAAASLDRYKYGLKVKANPLAIKGSLQDRLQAGIGNCERMGDYVNPAGRNLRTVWTIATRPSGVSHFAVMTPELAEHCIKAGTSEHGCCSACGAPWVRVVEREKMVIRRSTRGEEMGEFGQTQSSGTMVSPATLKTTGWRPSCPCEPSAPVPCRVLDPFGGSGTTAAVAAVLGRAGTLCEPNEGYRALMPARAEEVRRSMTKAPAQKVIPGQMSLI
jgi:DNA modification methylase